MKITIQTLLQLLNVRTEQPKFARVPLKVHVPMHIVLEQKTAGDAFRLACTASGLEDKEIYRELPIDQGYFSKLKKGQATLKEELVGRFCAIVDNTIYTDWRAHDLQRRLPAERAIVAAQRLRDSYEIHEECVSTA